MSTTDLERLVFEMDVNIKKMEAKLAKSMTDTEQFARKQQALWDKMGLSIGEDLSSAIGGTASQMPLLGSAMSGLGGPAALATGALAVLVVGLNEARKAMDWAATLTDTADHIGVTTTYIQEMRYAADEAGIDIGAMESALEALNGSLGAIKTGVGDGKVLEAFKALGITPEQVSGMKDASDLLPLLADRISKLGSQAEQVQIAKKLGIESLVPLLKQGSTGIDDLRTAARKLGLVLDSDTIKKLDEAQRKAELASQVIDANLKKAFADLAPVIAGASQMLAGFTGELNEALSAYDKWATKSHERSRLLMEARRKGITDRKEQNQYVLDNQSLNWEGAADGTRSRQSKTAPIYVNKTPPPPPPPPPPGGARGAKKAVANGMPADSATRALASGDVDWYPSGGGFRAATNDVELFEAGLERAWAVLDGLPVSFEAISEAADPLKDQLIAIGDEIAGSLSEAIVYGDDLGDALGQTFKRIAADWATHGLETIFKTLISGGGQPSSGGGSIVSGFMSLITGKRANGGPVSAGGAYLVGEREPELFVPNSSGRIMNGNQIAGMLAQAGGARSAARGIQVVVSSSKYFDVRVQEIAGPMASQAAYAGAQGGMGLSRADQANRARQILD